MTLVVATAARTRAAQRHPSASAWSSAPRSPGAPATRGVRPRRGSGSGPDVTVAVDGDVSCILIVKAVTVRRRSSSAPRPWCRRPLLAEAERQVAAAGHERSGWGGARQHHGQAFYEARLGRPRRGDLDAVTLGGETVPGRSAGTSRGCCTPTGSSPGSADVVTAATPTTTRTRPAPWGRVGCHCSPAPARLPGRSHSSASTTPSGRSRCAASFGVVRRRPPWWCSDPTDTRARPAMTEPGTVSIRAQCRAGGRHGCHRVSSATRVPPVATGHQLQPATTPEGRRPDRAGRVEERRASRSRSGSDPEVDTANENESVQRRGGFVGVPGGRCRRRPCRPRPGPRRPRPPPRPQCAGPRSACGRTS